MHVSEDCYSRVFFLHVQDLDDFLRRAYPEAESDTDIDPASLIVLSRPELSPLGTLFFLCVNFAPA